jgi:hypothetical protein
MFTKAPKHGKGIIIWIFESFMGDISTDRRATLQLDIFKISVSFKIIYIEVAL